MKLFELFTEAELAAQIEAKMVRAVPHPSGWLTLYNYTKVAQFTPELWNHVTDKCRGLIVDNGRHPGGAAIREVLEPRRCAPSRNSHCQPAGHATGAHT